ncbi:unnamed protein product [Moneuplotes crassus]|uniref:RING-type domain-containing protein n=1 Tax=Euplotes crassus TaxID=5936 RepID=A0AAD1X5D3_EUPCR|nr:unnamed protein product [Moneuplotes crassus]
MNKKHLDADDTEDATWLAREIGKFNGNLDRGMAFLLGANFQKFGKKYGRDAYTQLATILERALSDIKLGKNQMNQVYKELYEQECLSDFLESTHFKEYKRDFIKRYETQKSKIISDDGENSTGMTKSLVQTPSEPSVLPTISERLPQNAVVDSNFYDKRKEANEVSTFQGNLNSNKDLNEEEPEHSEKVQKAFFRQREEQMPHPAENLEHSEGYVISYRNSVDSQEAPPLQVDSQMHQNLSGEQIGYKRKKTGEEHEAHIELQLQKEELAQKLLTQNHPPENPNYYQNDDPMESYQPVSDAEDPNQAGFDHQEFARNRAMKEQLRFEEQDRVNKDELDVHKRSNSEELAPLKKIITQSSNLPKGIHDIRHIPDANAQAQLLNEHNQELSDPGEAEIIEKAFREQKIAKEQQDAFERLQRKLEQERKDKEVADQIQIEERIKVQQYRAKSICEICNYCIGDSEVVELSCGDFFHPSCFKKYVKKCVNQNSYPINCPDSDCDEAIGYTVLKNYCTQKLYAKIERARMSEHCGSSKPNKEENQSSKRSRKDSRHHMEDRDSKNEGLFTNIGKYFKRS